MFLAPGLHVRLVNGRERELNAAKASLIDLREKRDEKEMDSGDETGQKRSKEASVWRGAEEREGERGVWRDMRRKKGAWRRCSLWAP